MSLFQQRALIDGSMPYTHIAEVQAVSFTGPEMRIRLISVSPTKDLPVYFLPKDGANGDPLISRERVEAYYCPAVPRQPFPPDYDPEVDSAPQIETEYVSARYYQPGEKVIVLQDGQDFFVLSKLFPGYYSNVYESIGAEVEHEEWIAMMNGAAILTPLSIDGDSVILLNNGEVYKIPGGDTPINKNLFANYNFAYTMNRNAQFQIFVFPREPIVHLDNVNWTWAGGAYNYAYFDKITNSFYQKSYGENERFWSPSVAFPGRTPDVRLEVQSASPPGTTWLDELPAIEFYVTSSGMNQESVTRDFVNNDEHVEQVLSISRPWGTVASNPNEWKTSNWVPPILFCPDDSLSNPPEATDLPKPAVSFGFVDYKKKEYSGDRFDIHNEYRFVTGKIYAELKTKSLGKPLLGKDDYTYTETHTVEVKDSGYTLHVEDTYTVPDGYGQTVTMNQPGEVEQVFTVCTDGTNSLRKKPVLLHTDSWIGGGTTTSIVLSLSIEHYINNTLMFTSSFNTNGLRTIWNQRLYYIYSIDLVNKIILAHVYVYDEPGAAQRIEGVVIDSGGEYIVWTYDRSGEMDMFSEQINVPVWGTTNPPASPVGGDPTSFPIQYDHQGYVWKSPFFSNVSYPLTTDASSSCAAFGYPPGNVGTYFPCTPYDEDIRSILLMNTIHYDPSTSVQGPAQRKQHNVSRPMRDGWVVFMRCCFDPSSGTISYPYGSDIIKKNGAIITDGSYLLGTPDKELNLYEA